MTITSQRIASGEPIPQSPGSHSATSTEYLTFKHASSRLRNLFVAVMVFSIGCDQTPTDSLSKPDSISLFPGIDFNEIKDGKHMDTGLEFVNDPYFDIRTAESRAMMKIRKYKALPGERLQALAEYRSTGRNIDPLGDDYAGQSADFTDWCMQRGSEEIARNEEDQLTTHLALREMIKNREKDTSQ